MYKNANLKNITYFLGAGASYQACPIWHEQAEKMVEMGSLIASKHYQYENVNGLNDVVSVDEFFWYLNFFGKKGQEYGTVDTYASYLFKQQSSELGVLKAAISLFFTLWENTSDEIKYRNNNGVKERFKELDPRYISLLATLLTSEDRHVWLKSNIKFVTWNYDLQVERAILKFEDPNTKLYQIDDRIRFDSGKENSPLSICHLNGYNGFMDITEDGFFHLIDAKKSIKESADKVHGIYFENFKRKSNFMNFINFAWENHPRANFARAQAKEIFSNTDILVIIGYSFPPFNKEIDKALFSMLKDGTKIIYQDPKASRKQIEFLTAGKKIEIELLTDKLDHFYLPYEW